MAKAVVPTWRSSTSFPAGRHRNCHTRSARPSTSEYPLASDETPLHQKHRFIAVHRYKIAGLCARCPPPVSRETLRRSTRRRDPAHHHSDFATSVFVTGERRHTLIEPLPVEPLTQLTLHLREPQCCWKRAQARTGRRAAHSPIMGEEGPVSEHTQSTARRSPCSTRGTEYSGTPCSLRDHVPGCAAAKPIRHSRRSPRRPEHRMGDHEGAVHNDVFRVIADRKSFLASTSALGRPSSGSLAPANESY